MAASSEIRFKIGADTSALSAAFGKAESIAAAAGKSLEKKFSMKDAFKSGVLALGLSIENIAEKVSQLFTGGSKEDWQAAYDARRDADRIAEESALKRKEIATQIASLELKIAAAKADENADPKSVTETFSTLSLTGGVTTGTRTRLTETEAEAAKRAAEASAKRAALEARLVDLKDQQKAQSEVIADASRALNTLELEGQEKISALEQERETARQRLETARRQGLQTYPLEVAYLRKQAEVKQAIYLHTKATTEEEAKAAAAAKRAGEKYQDAYKDRNMAANALGTAKRDALAFGVEEAAEGIRGNQLDQAKAKKILEVEQFARDLYDKGPDAKVRIFRPERGDFEERDAEYYQNRALQMRRDFSRVRSGDQDPFRSLSTALENATEALTTATQQLLSPQDT